jgi:hypothetical protein
MVHHIVPSVRQHQMVTTSTKQLANAWDYMRTCQAVIEWSAEERDELTGWSNSRTLPAGDVFKAKLIIALADGKRYSTVEAELNTSRPTIARWKTRFEEPG